MNELLNGRKIQESMKYICNAILALMLSLFATYGLYNLLVGNKKVSHKEIISECDFSIQHSYIDVALTGSHRVYSPQSDSSSSSGGRRWPVVGGRRSAAVDSLVVEEVTDFNIRKAASPLRRLQSNRANICNFSFYIRKNLTIFPI